MFKAKEEIPLSSWAGWEIQVKLKTLRFIKAVRSILTLWRSYEPAMVGWAANLLSMFKSWWREGSSKFPIFLSSQYFWGQYFDFSLCYFYVMFKSWWREGSPKFPIFPSSQYFWGHFLILFRCFTFVSCLSPMWGHSEVSYVWNFQTLNIFAANFLFYVLVLMEGGHSKVSYI